MVFKQKFESRISECDPWQRVTPPAVLDYFQETASRHCVPYGLAVPEIMEVHGSSWVLSGMAVSFDSYPLWPGELEVETWARSLRGFKALRDFLMKDGKGRVCARGSSIWALIDVESRRPLRMDKFGALMEREPEMEAWPGARPGKVVLPEAEERVLGEISVSPADLDYNLHVNNIRYLVWLITLLEPSFLKARELAELNIAFLGETVLGDRLALRHFPGDSAGREVYNFLRVEDGKEVCRIFCRWRER